MSEIFVSPNFDMFSERLREERERLGYSKQEFATLGGVGLNTQYRIERECEVVSLKYLKSLSSHGVDVSYILTGVRPEDGKTLRDGSASYGAHEDKTPPELEPLFNEIIKLWYSSTVTKEQIENWRKMFEMMNPFLNPQAARPSALPLVAKAPADTPKTDPNDYSLFSRRPGQK